MMLPPCRIFAITPASFPQCVRNPAQQHMFDWIAMGDVDADAERGMVHFVARQFQPSIRADAGDDEAFVTTISCKSPTCIADGWGG